METKPLNLLKAPPIEESPKIEYEIKGYNNLSFNFTIIKESRNVNLKEKEKEDIFILYIK